MTEITDKKKSIHSPEIFFDSECELCKFAVNRSSLEFTKTPLMNSEYGTADAMVVRVDETIVKGFEGVVLISEYTPSLFPLLPVLYLFRFLHLGNLIYSVVAKNRNSTAVQRFFRRLQRYAASSP
jgi:Protein of unknown function, DUF393.